MPEPVLAVAGLRKEFGELVAVDDVTFTVPAAGSLAIVGESGSGKTTVARMIVGLEHPTRGTITACGNDRSQPARAARDRRRRGREVQIVFQDPYTSLDPRQTAEQTLSEMIRLHHGWPADRRQARVTELTDLVGLDSRQARALPRSLSGGQRHRVAIARALAAEPRVLILDEPVAALDVSIQAQVLNLLAEIRDRTGVSYILISHDLAVVRQLTDQAIVMHRGQVVERGATAQVLDDPQHPYTQRLRASVPRPGWKPARRPVAGAATHGEARPRPTTGRTCPRPTHCPCSVRASCPRPTRGRRSSSGPRRSSRSSTPSPRPSTSRPSPRPGPRRSATPGRANRPGRWRASRSPSRRRRRSRGSTTPSGRCRCATRSRTIPRSSPSGSSTRAGSCTPAPPRRSSPAPRSPGPGCGA